MQRLFDARKLFVFDMINSLCQFEVFVVEALQRCIDTIEKQLWNGYENSDGAISVSCNTQEILCEPVCPLEPFGLQHDAFCHP